jgi:hypothetical protein
MWLPAPLSFAQMSLDKNALFAQFQAKLHEQGAAMEDMDSASDWAQILSDMGFSPVQRGVLLKQIHQRQTSAAASHSGKSKQKHQQQWRMTCV